MNKKTKAILIICSIVFLIGISLFSFFHLEVKYIPFKTCELGQINVSENYNFFEKMEVIENMCYSNCKFPSLLFGGVGENSQGFYCPYKSII